MTKVVQRNFFGQIKKTIFNNKIRANKPAKYAGFARNTRLDFVFWQDPKYLFSGSL